MYICYHHDVRTTLTLDSDITERIREEMRKSGKSFKETVNEYLRRGLNARQEMAKLEPFRIQPRMLGCRSGLSYENIGDLLEQLEGPAHR